MGTIIDLEAARRRRRGTTFAFDLASPWTYLAAHAVTADFPDAEWVPAAGAAAPYRAAVEAAAEALELRFAWPKRGVPEGTAANRAAAFAAEHGVAREFALAAARLAWGWGEDLDDHELIAQAAGIAELPLDRVVEATFDPRRDAVLRASAADGAPMLTSAGLELDGPALARAQTSSMKTISVESLRRGPSFRMRV
jgi:2-hydroxychromene-2-carboxylate isomerase